MARDLASVVNDVRYDFIATDRRAMQESIDRVRALHAKHENTIHTTPKWICSHRYCIDGAGDQCAWPCPTIKALESTETEA